MVVVIRGEALELLVANQMPTPAAASDHDTAAPTIVHFLREPSSSFGPTSPHLLCRPVPPVGRVPDATSASTAAPDWAGPSNRPNIDARPQSPVKFLRAG